MLGAVGGGRSGDREIGRYRGHRNATSGASAACHLVSRPSVSGSRLMLSRGAGTTGWGPGRGRGGEPDGGLDGGLDRGLDGGLTSRGVRRTRACTYGLDGGLGRGEIDFIQI
jgi:hypothetical protein